jgi:hypothetical protein
MTFRTKPTDVILNDVENPEDHEYAIIYDINK